MKVSEAFQYSAQALEEGNGSEFICIQLESKELTIEQLNAAKDMVVRYFRHPDSQGDALFTFWQAYYFWKVTTVEEELSTEELQNMRILACCFLSHIAADLEASGDL